MNKALEIAEQLKNEMIKSDCYINYLKAKEILIKNQDLYKKVVEFRSCQMNDRALEFDNYQMSFDREKYLSKLMSDLMLNDIANNFFKYEKEFLCLYNKITNIISKDFELDFFELDNV